MRYETKDNKMDRPIPLIRSVCLAVLDQSSNLQTISKYFTITQADWIV